MIFTNLIQTNLKTSWVGKNIEYYSFTDSTNDDACELILNNEAEEGMIIITDYQKKGRGRRNNKWLSSPGENLTFSLILKKDVKKLPLLSILSGIAVVKGIKQFANIECNLKWPNDIMLNNKKIGGILIETKNMDTDSYVIIGIGLNVNQQEISQELVSIASSLRIENSNPIQREPLLAFILNEFEKLYNTNSEQWPILWKKYCNHLNKEITFHKDDTALTGYFINIDNHGNAIINTDSEQISVSTGILEIL